MFRTLASRMLVSTAVFQRQAALLSVTEVPCSDLQISPSGLAPVRVLITTSRASLRSDSEQLAKLSIYLSSLSKCSTCLSSGDCSSKSCQSQHTKSNTPPVAHNWQCHESGQATDMRLQTTSQVTKSSYSVRPIFKLLLGCEELVNTLDSMEYSCELGLLF